MDSEIINVKLPNRFHVGPKTALAILVFIGTTGVTAFWQYSDARNTITFLPRNEYEKNRTFDQTLAEKDRQIILEKLEEIKRVQHEMKQLLKERNI